MTKRISDLEIRELYKEWNTPERVIAHCKAVSDVGTRLASELNKHGYNFDLELIRATGLVHDVARIKDSHEVIGYEILKKLGYEDEANIVRVHMTYPNFNEVNKLDECDIVCMADRIVKENKYVGIDERIDYILQKAGDNEEVRCNILRKKEETKILIHKLEEIMGITMDELFNKVTNT